MLYLKLSLIFSLLLICLLDLDPVEAKKIGRISRPRPKPKPQPKPDNGDKKKEEDESKKNPAVVEKQKELEKKYLKYGEKIWIQSQSKSAAWLTGARGKKNNGVDTRNHLHKDEVKKESVFQWVIQANDKNSPGKKDGDCVKYGDLVFIYTRQHDKEQREWLNGARGGGNSDVHTYNIYNKDHRDKTYAFTWQFRPDLGNGKRSDKENPVKGKGECIMEHSSVFIQNRFVDEKWLSVYKPREGKNEDGVRTTNEHGSTSVKSLMWVLRRDHGRGDTASIENAMVCQPKESVSRWIRKHSSNGDQTITYTTGISSTEGKDYTKSSHWEVGVTTTVEASAAFGSVSVESSFNYGQEVSNTVSSSLEFSESEEYSASFGPGVVWQFDTAVTDICGTVTDFPAKHLYLSASYDEPPCCVPGYFADPEVAHGPCKGDSPCACGDYVCSGQKLEDERKKEWEEEKKISEDEDQWEDEWEEKEEETESESEEEEYYEESESEEEEYYEESDSYDRREDSYDNGKKYKTTGGRGDYGGGYGSGDCSESEKAALVEEAILDALYGTSSDARKLLERNLGDVVITNNYNIAMGESGGLVVGGGGGGSAGGGGSGVRGGGYGYGHGHGHAGGSSYKQNGCSIDDDLLEFAENMVLHAAYSI